MQKSFSPDKAILSEDPQVTSHSGINRVALVGLTALTLASVLATLDYLRRDRTSTENLSITTQPHEQITVVVFASDYRLYFRYPGDDRVSGTNDDRFGKKHLYVPAGCQVHLQLNSHDFVYTVEIPRVEVYEIAAPDLVFEVDFIAPRETGTFDLLSSQMCGYDHSDLLGTMIVQTDNEFERTMQSLSTTPLPPTL
tara:strand:- start:244 stop:831 length:588 start_codon:yes stop_codon:yes gene_type:complete